MPLQCTLYTEVCERAMLFDSNLNVQDKRIFFFFLLLRWSVYARCTSFIILSRPSFPSNVALVRTAPSSDQGHTGMMKKKMKKKKVELTKTIKRRFSSVYDSRMIVRHSRFPSLRYDAGKTMQKFMENAFNEIQINLENS